MPNMKHNFEKVILDTLGLCIKKRRVDLNISQEELADRAGLHRTYIGDIERGKRNVSIINIFRLSLALNVTLRDLLKPFDNICPANIKDYIKNK